MAFGEWVSTRLWAWLLCAARPSPACVAGPTCAGSGPRSRLPAPCSITIYKVGKGFCFFTFIFSFSHVLVSMQVEMMGYERTSHLKRRQPQGIA